MTLLRSRAAQAALAALLAVAALPSPAAEEPSTLTVYSTRPQQPADGQTEGFALVSEEHSANVRAGVNRFVAADLPRTLDPATVLLAPVGEGPEIRVLATRWQPADSLERVLRAHIGGSVSVTTREGTPVTGTLLDTEGGLLLRGVDGTVHLVRDYPHVQLPAQEPTPRARPALEWELEAQGKGDRRLQLSYEVTGIGWWSEYQVTRQAGPACRLRVDGGALVSNGTGRGFEPERLWLVAGEVNRVRTPARPQVMMMRAESAPAPAADVQREELGQYHRYDLGGPWSLPADGVTRLPLGPPVTDVPCRERLVFHATGGWPTPYREPATRPDPPGDGRAPVTARLEFENSPEAGLGEPLPAGRVRVLRPASGDTPPQLLGEDSIEHTPRGAAVELRLGTAFDITGRRRQADFSLDSARRTMSETIEVELSNARDSAVTVDVIEDLYRWTGWEIVETSEPFQRLDSARVRFTVEVPPDGTRTVRYTARYTW